MQINSKSQIVFGIAISDEQVEEIHNKLPNIHSYNDLDEGGSKILGLLVTQQNTSYGFSEAKKVTLLSPEKELKLTDLLKQHFHQQPSYFLIASCS